MSPPLPGRRRGNSITTRPLRSRPEGGRDGSHLGRLQRDQGGRDDRAGALMEDCSIRDAALKLQNWQGTMPPPRHTAEILRDEANAPLRFALQSIDATHPYLTSRNVTPQTVRTFGLGLYTGTGLLRGRI